MFATDLENKMDKAADAQKRPAQANIAREQVLRKVLNAGSTRGLYRDPAAGAGKDPSVDGGDVLNKPRQTTGFKRRR